MFAQLGDIQFDLITYFNGINKTMSYNYAEHDRIENTPLLQFLGRNLDEITLKLNFHCNFCVPEEELASLIDAADNAIPLEFIKGNGDYVGVFIIEEIGQATEQASPEGDLMSIQVDIKLREFTGEIPEEFEEEEKGFKKK